jgi:CheY-like chemotaxis protein
METTILLVEDSAEDCEAVRGALHEAGIKSRLCVVEDGDHAISYLCGEGRYANRSRFPFPSVMLLDLKMPRVDGFEVLEWIKDNPDVRRSILVVVLSGYNQLQLVNRAYSLGAHSFLVKPCSVRELENLISAFPDFWNRRVNSNHADTSGVQPGILVTSVPSFS